MKTAIFNSLTSETDFTLEMIPCNINIFCVRKNVWQANMVIHIPKYTKAVIISIVCQVHTLNESKSSTRLFVIFLCKKIVMITFGISKTFLCIDRCMVVQPYNSTRAGSIKHRKGQLHARLFPIDGGRASCRNVYIVRTYYFARLK